MRKNINGLIEDYTYNVQGWLTSQDSPYYSARLKYYDSENPSYTGNITEWNWGGAGTMPHTYKYEYDALSRLTEARYSGNMGTDRYSERGIKYDRNGNILKMTRGLNEQLEYKYNDAGQLYGINQASVVYDNLGNLVRDSRNGLTIAYNFLNLPMQIKSSADNFELNYCYRADGGKFSALDADKTGLIYIGSLVYKQTAGSKIEFESAAFSDGRFRKNTHSWNTNYAPEYYLKDHLGSPRAFVDWSGELIALRDYYAFGKSWLKPNSPATSDLSRFNGKEEQTVGDAGLLDFGARFYHPDLGCWLTQDPMATEYINISPYAYCVNNPIRYIDPDGRQIGITTIIDGRSVLYTWRSINGVWGFYDSYGNKYSGNDPFVLSVIDSITTIMQGACGSSLIQNIVNNPEIVDIKLSNENNYFSYNKDNATYIVYWNPNSNVLIPTTDGMKENIPYVSQAHELQHGLDYISGTGDSGVWITVMDKDGEVKNIKNTEISATHMENLIRAEHGLPLRTHYLPDGNSRSAIIDRQTSRSLYYDCNGNTTFQKIISPNKGYKYKRR